MIYEVLMPHNCFTGGSIIGEYQPTKIGKAQYCFTDNYRQSRRLPRYNDEGQLIDYSWNTVKADAIAKRQERIDDLQDEIKQLKAFKPKEEE